MINKNKHNRYVRISKDESDSPRYSNSLQSPICKRHIKRGYPNEARNRGWKRQIKSVPLFTRKVIGGGKFNNRNFQKKYNFNWPTTPKAISLFANNQCKDKCLTASIAKQLWEDFDLEEANAYDIALFANALQRVDCFNAEIAKVMVKCFYPEKANAYDIALFANALQRVDCFNAEIAKVMVKCFYPEKANACNIALFANALQKVNCFNAEIAKAMVKCFDPEKTNEQSIALFANALQRVDCFNAEIAKAMVKCFDPEKTNEQNIALFANALQKVDCFNAEIAKAMVKCFDPEKTNEQNIALFANALQRVDCFNAEIVKAMVKCFDPEKTNEQNIALFANALQRVDCFNAEIVKAMVKCFHPEEAGAYSIALFANALQKVNCFNAEIAKAMVKCFHPEEAGACSIALFANALQKVNCFNAEIAKAMVKCFHPEEAGAQYIALFANTLIEIGFVVEKNITDALLNKFKTVFVAKDQQGKSCDWNFVLSLAAKILAVSDCKVVTIQKSKFIDFLKAFYENRKAFVKSPIIDFIHLYHFIEYYRLNYQLDDKELAELSELCSSLMNKKDCTDTFPSELQKNVTRVLKRLGISFKQEIFVEGFIIDIVLLGRDGEAVGLLEINGPSHFEDEGKGEYNQKTQFKHKFLELKGNVLYNVNYEEWHLAVNEGREEGFLKSILPAEIMKGEKLAAKITSLNLDRTEAFESFPQVKNPVPKRSFSAMEENDDTENRTVNMQTLQQSVETTTKLSIGELPPSGRYILEENEAKKSKFWTEKKDTLPCAAKGAEEKQMEIPLIERYDRIPLNVYNETIDGDDGLIEGELPPSAV